MSARSAGTMPFITRFTAWAPGFGDPHAWDEWAGGKRDIPAIKDGPDLAFTDPIFRRRLSQISRMTIQVLHDLIPIREDTKVVFLSFRGEITRQFKINRMIIEDQSVLPAAFSLSVFNTPPALAAMALGLTAGYTAVYPADGFRSALLAAAAPVLSGSAGETVLVYADEFCPPEYGDLRPEDNTPLAFGAVLSGAADPGGGEPVIPFPFTSELSAGVSAGTVPDSPREFLKYLLLCRKSQKYEQDKTGAH
ncbi:MAG: beta-ketoacyl synthase chain length factor [Treponema sp.]|nr:beta-ketoacyl synthase chain length factor [Treponema sp.]